MWTAIVGVSSEERRNAAITVVERLRARSLEVAGAIQGPAPPDAGGGWDATDLATGKRLPIARRSDTPDLCDWSFDEASFATIRQAIADSNATIVVLEFGQLEARGRGNWPAALEVLDRGHTLIACIRPTSLARIAIDLPDVAAALELPVGPEDVEEFVATVAEPSAGQQ